MYLQRVTLHIFHHDLFFTPETFKYSGNMYSMFLLIYNHETFKLLQEYVLPVPKNF